ncbi:PREDICTED: RNA-binding protein 44 [Merops nubicus]|uniref:RNA-binding protein 44 n=1 Tax=Merops nubicus TaxID=57421 RepID=UPI0004F079C2|nr:PREDICTED: RNA-binding protein 44 [Merops nubicus]
MELEKNGSVRRRSFSQTSRPFPDAGEAEHALVRDAEAGANHSGFGQARSANVSELKLSEESLPYLSSSLDADLEMYNKKGMRIGCAHVDESKEEADTMGRAHGDVHCNCRACDVCRQGNLIEDSELEYLSAHEEDFGDRNSSSELSEQRETIGTETTELIDLVHEVRGGGVAQEQNIFDLSGDGSPVSESGVGGQMCPEAAVLELTHLLQGSLSGCSGMTGDHQEEQTEYHSDVYGSILEGGSWESKERIGSNPLVYDSLENGEVKDMTMTDGTLPPQTTGSGEVFGKADRHIQSISVVQEHPLLPPRERAPAVAAPRCEPAEDSDLCSCEESGVCTRGAGCLLCTARGAGTPFPVSEILLSKNPFFGVEGADKSSCGNTNCLNLELEHSETLKNVTRGSTVNQAADVKQALKSELTTSRSTSAQVCLSSKAVNTEIKMINESQPMGWHHETYADMACNTEWSCGAGSTEKISSQLAETLQEHSDDSTAAADRSSQMQESKPELCSSNLKICTERPVHLDKQAVNNSVPSYCQEILRRATEAELQILNAHYRMCYQHCLKIYSLALEENTCFSRCNGNTELRSSVMLVLQELRKNYQSMRGQIKRGVPLNALPPLSVEVKLFQISSSYVPCKLFREDLCYETFEEHHKDQDVECGCVKNEEGSQYWFDAKEDLTAADFSVISEETEKQQGKQDTVDLREVKIAKSRNECTSVRVGVLSSSVSEDDLRAHFQKYQVSDTIISMDVSNYRYSILSFKDTDKAKLAVEEMNKKKIKGKQIHVKLLNTSPDNKYLLPQVLKNKLLCEIQPAGNSQRNDEDKTVTSASNSVEAPGATSASEKTHFLPVTTSNVTCATQVPAETKCPGLKSSNEDSVPYLLGVSQKDAEENTLQKKSAPFSMSSYDVFTSNTLNLSSFTKVLKKLQEIHPDASRDKIVGALLEVRRNNNGTLSGLSISSIVERTSVILRKRGPRCGWRKQ